LSPGAARNLRAYGELDPQSLNHVMVSGIGRIHPVEDDDYRIHYTITSPAFRRLYFSAVEMNNTCKAAEIFGSERIVLGW
jgi:hypothetical protein